MHTPTTTRSNWPFPHVRMSNVYEQATYTALANAMEHLVEEGQFCRTIPGYDAMGLALNQQSRYPLSMFCLPAFRDWVAGLFNVTPTPYMNVGAHYHLVGSKSGFIHNDFNPAWFVEADPTAAIQLGETAAICHYKFGTGSAPKKIRVVRGVVLIYYLLNDWQPGDGGATGLYLTKDLRPNQPTVRCPPINNSLIAFECTPRSYHAFLTNRVHPRTSIILWVHRPYDEACRLYGEENLEQWTPESLPPRNAFAS